MNAIRFSSLLLFSTLILLSCKDQEPSSNTEQKVTLPSKPTEAISANTATSPTSVYASDKEGWLVNIEDAYAQSVKENKPILANFSGTDWCGWCKKLDQDVFTTPEFKNWAAKNVVLLEVDFPRRKQLPEKNKEQNAAMAQSLSVTSYPTIWLLKITREPENARFKVKPLGKTGYAKTPKEFIGSIQSLLLK